MALEQRDLLAESGRSMLEDILNSGGGKTGTYFQLARVELNRGNPEVCAAAHDLPFDVVLSA